MLCDKPAGKTSHDVVAALRRGLPGGRRRVGHAGTLDPFATGLLIVLVGRATRAQRFFMALPKTYRAVARLGAVSTTGDPEGEITQTGVLPDAHAALPTGPVTQRPPAHSAVKVDGERAYRRARRGEAVEVPERTVTVHRFEQLWREGDRAEFEIECSSGTYVRTLVETLDDAYCESLRRIAIGHLRLPDDAPEEVAVEELMSFLPEVALDEDQAEGVRHGVSIEGEADLVRLMHEGRLLAVARGREGKLRPEVVLA